MNWNDYYIEQAGVVIIKLLKEHYIKEVMDWEVCLVDLLNG